MPCIQGTVSYSCCIRHGQLQLLRDRVQRCLYVCNTPHEALYTRHDMLCYKCCGARAHHCRILHTPLGLASKTRSVAGVAARDRVHHCLYVASPLSLASKRSAHFHKSMCVLLSSGTGAPLSNVGSWYDKPTRVFCSSTPYVRDCVAQTFFSFSVFAS